MQGEADGDGGRTRRNTRKRALHVAPQDGFVIDNRSSKRRLTAGAQGHDDAESTSNGSRFKSRGQKVERNGTSRSPKLQLDKLQFSSRSSRPPAAPAPQKHGSFDSPISNDSAARLSGPSGATGGRQGATPLFVSYGRPYQSLAEFSDNDPPGFEKLGKDQYRLEPSREKRDDFDTRDQLIADAASPSQVEARAEKRKPANKDGHKPHQEARGRFNNIRRGASSTQSWPPKRQDALQPSSRLNGTRDTPQAITSSDDDSYVEEREKEGNSDDDAFPTTRQRSARLKARGSTLDCLGTRGDGLNDENGLEQGSYKKTPSGKDYHELPHPIWNKHSPKFVLIPDGYKLKYSQHARSEFNDNLDEDATLEYIRSGTGGTSSLESIVVSQNLRRPPGLASDEEEKWISGPQLDGSSSSGDPGQDSAATTPSELDRAMAESKVWAYVAPLIPKSWSASINDGQEKRAFIQAISLPLRNEMDMDWLAGTKGSHQRLYRALMSVIFQAIGIEAHCKPCDSKIPERRRNCKVLPPEAADMQELQKVCGSQCVNCFFFQASRPCDLPDSSTTTKQTPIPIPVPPFPRTTPVVERSHDSPAAANALRPTVTSRPFVPPYSLYKVQKTDKPISESPVPIPSFATQGPSRQSQSHNPSAEADEWEIAPGKLMDGKPVAFSTSFLRREKLSLDAAQKLRPNHRVLNKSIAALHQVHIDPGKDPEKGWNCTFSVIRGVLKVKAGDVEARIGQGGMVLVEEKCIITNVLHKDATIQVCWVREG